MAKIKCEKCNGDGFTAEHANHPHPDGDCLGECPIQVQCENCQGTGEITPTLYALTPIDQTEGLADGTYWVKFPAVPDLQVKQFENGAWNANYMNIAESYLRPLPEGTVAVSKEEISEFLWPYTLDAQLCEKAANEFIKTKLAQMGG